MKKLFKNRKTLVAFCCYGLFLALWLGVSLLRLAGDSMRTQQPLEPAGARLENLTAEPNGTLTSQTVDPQLIFEGVEQKLRLVRLEADFKQDPGELELFYTRKEGQGFSMQKRVVGVPQNDGSILYSLPPGKVRDLRIDPGTAGNNTITIHAITLNPKPGAGWYLAPSLRLAAAFLLLPALALCLIYTIIEGAGFLEKQRRKRAQKAKKQPDAR